MYDFAWPWVAAAAPLPWLAGYWLKPARPESNVAVRVPFFAQFSNRPLLGRPRQDRLRLAIAVIAWTALIVGACRPQLVGDPVGLPQSGRDLMLAVDISGSMKTRDLHAPNQSNPNQPSASRISVVKRVAGDFIAGRKGDRVGLILFGTRAYLQVPLTFDTRVVSTVLDEAVIGLAGERTAIGDAIGLALKTLHQRPTQARVLVLLTDGSNTAGMVEPIRAAELAAVAGLRIHVIGVGAASATPSNTISELDEAVLRRISKLSGGQYFRAHNAIDLTGIYRLIDQLEPAAEDDEVLRSVDELYPWPLGIAVILVGLLLAADAAHDLRRTRQPAQPRHAATSGSSR